MTEADFSKWMQNPGRDVLVMGVLNVTPDSFSDGGRYYGVDAAVAHAESMCEAGAQLLDIGGESTRPGSVRVDAEEQARRIIPVIDRLAGRVSALLSVDTTRSAVARSALDRGAQLINDISAGMDDPEMLRLAGERDVPIVLMHMRGQPATMQLNPTYANVVCEVKQFLADRVSVAEAAGVRSGRILIDPGIGFGKTMEHNLTLLRGLRELAALGRPLLVGTSRKGFIGRISGESEPSGRVMGTAASVAWSVANGAAIVRVHDVEPMNRVVRTVRAIMNGFL